MPVVATDLPKDSAGIELIWSCSFVEPIDMDALSGRQTKGLPAGEEG